MKPLLLLLLILLLRFALHSSYVLPELLEANKIVGTFQVTIFLVYLFIPIDTFISCRNGTGRNGTGRNGSRRNGTGRNGTGRNGMGRNGTRRNDTKPVSAQDPTRTRSDPKPTLCRNPSRHGTQFELNSFRSETCPDSLRH
ncbi:hypothetical protein Hdeb2414_s0009g00324481 [Helianthus debilis subsp. tardiflorus]